MRPEAQILAIAEACGWKFKLSGDEHNWWVARPDETLAYEGGKSRYWPIHVFPDYLNDLNAMHEAEKVVFNLPYTPLDYMRAIYNVVNRGKDGHFAIDCARATAAQRAEALLKTIGKWEESNQ